MTGTIEKDQIPNLTAGANADAPPPTEAATVKPTKPKKVAKALVKKSVKAQTKKVAKKIEPKLPAAAVERLRNGTSSIPIETKTLGLTYSVIQRALKRELGAAGYTALIKANRAAKSKVTPKSKAKPAKAAGKKRSRKVKAAQ